MLSKKRPLAPKAKKEDLDDWINKEFQNIANKSQENQERQPLKPNFKVTSKEKSIERQGPVINNAIIHKSEEEEKITPPKNPAKPNFYDKIGIKKSSIVKNDPTQFIKEIQMEYNIPEKKKNKPSLSSNDEFMSKKEKKNEQEDSEMNFRVKKSEKQYEQFNENNQENDSEKNLSNPPSKKNKDSENEYNEDFEDYGEDFEPLEETPQPQTIKPSKNLNEKNSKSKTLINDDSRFEGSAAGNNNKDIIETTFGKPINLGKNYKKPFQNITSSNNGLNNNEKMDERLINLENAEEQKEKVEVSIIKLNEQENRVVKFGGCLDMDLYEEIFEIAPSTEYDVYMSKIKSGCLKNSSDQSNADQPCKDSQTDEIFYNDGENQCPEDFNKTFIKKKNNDDNLDEDDTILIQNTNRLIQFISNATPIIEEILSRKDQSLQHKSVKPASLISLKKPSFLSDSQILKIVSYPCVDENLSNFICYSLKINMNRYSLIVEHFEEKHNRFFLANTFLSKIIKINNYLVGGTEEGTLVLWDLRLTDSFYKGGEINDVIKKFKQEINTEIILRGPNFTTEFQVNNVNNFLAEFNHMGVIISLFAQERDFNTEIISLDNLNNVIFWNIIELSMNESEMNYLQFGISSKIKITQTMQINLSNIFSDDIYSQTKFHNFNYFSVDLNENLLFLSSNNAIYKADKLGSNSVKHPNIYLGSEEEESFPRCLCGTNSNFFLAGFNDGRIGFFIKNYAYPKLWLSNFANSTITEIQIMFVNVKMKETQKRIKLYDYTKLIATDKLLNIYIFDLVKDKKKPIEKISLQHVVKEKADYYSIELSEINGISLFIRINISTSNKNIYTYYLELSKYIEKDPKLIKTNNQNLINLLLNNFEE